MKKIYIESFDYSTCAVASRKSRRLCKIITITRTDLCGPLFLKPKEKIWTVVFSYLCTVCKAIHFDLFTALSMESFIQALRRFIARWGRLSAVWTAEPTLKVQDLLKIPKKECFPIKWKFIPPYWSVIGEIVGTSYSFCNDFARAQFRKFNSEF